MERGQVVLIALCAALTGAALMRLTRARRDLAATRAATAGLRRAVRWLLLLVVAAMALLVGALRAGDPESVVPGPSTSASVGR